MKKEYFIMKRKTIGAIAVSLSAITAAFCLTACGSSDKSSSGTETTAATTAAAETTAAPSTEAPKSTLIGTWDSVEAPGTYYTFNEDGKGVLGGEGYTVNFTYVDKGTSVELTSEGTTSALVWNYTIEGDKLSMTDAEDTTTLTYTKGEAKTTDSSKPATENASSLVGTWACDTEEVTFTFNSDGTGSTKAGAIESSFTYVVNGSTVELNFANVDYPQTSKYTIEGDKLTMTDAANISVTYTKK